MGKYTVRREQGKFLLCHKGWFNRWKTDYEFTNIAGLMNFIIENWWFNDFVWEFPQPTLQDSEKTPMGSLTSLEATDLLSTYRYLRSIAKDKNFNTETADLCFVYDDKDNIYKVVDKPYNSFEESFRRTHCLPCWSTEAFEGYINAANAWERIEDEKIRTDTRYFYYLSEYEQWRNENPHAKILEFKDVRSPWTSLSYEVTYEYKNADRPKTP